MRVGVLSWHSNSSCSLLVSLVPLCVLRLFSFSFRTALQAIFFLEGASASESDFARILNRFFIILYLPKMTLLKDTCLTYEELLSHLDERLGGPQKFQQNSDFIH